MMKHKRHFGRSSYVKQLLLFISALWLSILALPAQDNTYSTSADSDPEATALLDLMERYLAELTSIESEFTMDIQYPEADVQRIKGTLDQEEAKYRIETSEYILLCDGGTRWVHDIVNKEVTIYNADTSELTTPTDYLTLYQDEQFAYRLLDQTSNEFSAIEFKPLDKYSDYAKLRLTLKSADGAPVALEVFEKGGGTIVITIDSLQQGAAKDIEWFRFDESAYPGVHVEDLRID